MSTKVSNKINENSSAELPDPRKGKAVRHDVALPLERTSFSTVIYSISGAMLLYLLYYAYIVNQWKTEAGGWWNLVIGTSSSRGAPPPTDGNRPPESVIPFGSGTEFESKPGTAGEQLENRIAELAEQLGIAEPDQLASAIKPLVHPTKASALLDAEPKETKVHESGGDGEKDKERKSRLVEILVEDLRRQRQIQADADSPLGWVETVVGMDEPPSEMPV